MENELAIPLPNGWRRFAFIEPPILLYLCAAGMSITILSDLIVFQTCRTLLDKNNTICDVLHTNSNSKEAHHLDEMIQGEASYIIMCKSLIEGCFGAFISLFFGSWSDKYGRRPLLLIGYFAPTCSYLLLSILTRFDINPWMILISSIPSVLGGSSGVFLASFCYVTDITDKKKRVGRLGILQGCIVGGLVIGTFIGPLIFNVFGYSVLFGIAAILTSLAFFYVLFYVPETMNHNESQNKWANLFNFTLVKELILTASRKRSGYSRWVLWSSILIVSLNVIIFEGLLNINFLFVSARLGWDAETFSIFNGIGMILSVIGITFGINVMRKLFGLSDIHMALIGSVSGFFGAIVYAFSFKSWHMYLGTSVGIFGGIIPPTIRSILSKSAPPEDTGKVFSLTTFMETLLPLGGASLYSVTYSNYMPPVYPSPVYLLTAGIFLLITLFIIFIDTQLASRSPVSYAPIVED